MSFERIMQETHLITEHWKRRFAEVCPEAKQTLRSKLAGALASVGIDTDEKLETISDLNLSRTPGVGRGGVDLRRTYIARIKGSDEDDFILENFKQPEMDWYKAIDAMREQAKRDMNAAVDFATTHRDQPNAALQAFLMRSNASLLSRIADCFSQGLPERK